MIVQPYLSFEGRCQEAIDFYKQAIGAEVQMLMHFKEAPPGSCGPDGITPAMADKVMHASLKIGESIVMATDGNCGGESGFKGITLTISVKTDAEAKKYFDALSAGGQVMVPLGPTFFASSFGMLADKFGVAWMVLAGNDKNP